MELLVVSYNRLDTTYIHSGPAYVSDLLREQGVVVGEDRRKSCRPWACGGYGGGGVGSHLEVVSTLSQSHEYKNAVIDTRQLQIWGRARGGRDLRLYSLLLVERGSSVYGSNTSNSAWLPSSRPNREIKIDGESCLHSRYEERFMNRARNGQMSLPTNILSSISCLHFYLFCFLSFYQTLTINSFLLSPSCHLQFMDLFISIITTTQAQQQE